jgi:hypothetical protein
MSLSPTIELMKADARPGACIACGGPLRWSGRGRHPVLCPSPDCEQTYQDVWHADEHESRKARTAARRGLLSAPHRLLVGWQRWWMRRCA